MEFKEMIKESKYIEPKKRDKMFWRLYLETLNKICEKEIFARGMFSVIVSEYEDSRHLSTFDKSKGT